MTKQNKSSGEFGGSRYFLNIPAGVAHDPDLLKAPKSILIFGEIWSMLNVTGEFFMSTARMAKLYGCSQTTIKNALKLLEKKGLITRQNVYKEESKEVIHRRISTGPKVGQYIAPPPVNQLPEGGATDCPRVGQQVGQIIEQSNRSNNRLINSTQAKPGNPKKGKKKLKKPSPLSDPIIKAIRSRSRLNHESIFLSYKDYLSKHPDGGSAADQNEWIERMKALYGWYGWNEERKRAIDQALAEGKSWEEIDSLSIPGMPDDH